MENTLGHVREALWSAARAALLVREAP